MVLELNPAGPAEQPDPRRHSRRRLRDMPLSQPVEGEVLDLASGGLGLRAWSALAVHQEYFFTIGPESSKARLRGRVVWCRLVPSNDPHFADWLPPYRAGVEFVAVSQ